MNTADQLQEFVTSRPYWYHRINLPHGITTPGGAPISADAYRIPERMDNMRVLDVGAWDGYWTFEALKRGAKEVVAIDDFSDYLGWLEVEDREAWENFDFCRNALGYDEKVCSRIDMSVYDVDESKLGRFDYIFFFGVLYHLRHPLLALDKLSALCDGEIYIESAILNEFSPYKGGLGKGYQDDMVMEFYPGKQYGGNDSNWWVPTLKCLANMVVSSGFSHADMWKLNPTSLHTCRGFIRGYNQATKP